MPSENPFDAIERGENPFDVIENTGFVKGLGFGAVESLTGLAGLPGDIASSLPETARATGAFLPGIPGLALSAGALPTTEQLRSFAREKGLLPDGKLPESAERGRIAGRVLTDVATLAVGGVGAAPALSKVGPKLTRQIFQFAKDKPVSFLAGELTTGAGAAAGAVAAREIAPESTGAQIAGEIAGGLAVTLSPVRLGIRLAKETVRRFRSATSREGVEAAAGNLIRNALKEVGEDPEQIAKALEAPEPQGIQLTAAQKTGSPTLLGVEKKIAAQNGKFSKEARDKLEMAFSTLREAVDGLAKTGDPKAVSAAAKLRDRYFQELLSQRVKSAEIKAAEAIAKAKSGTTKPAASAEVFRAVDDALKDANDIERSLWAKIPRDVPVEPAETKAALQRIKDELLPEETFTLQNAVERISEGASNSGEMLRLRSRLLETARELRAQRKFGDARRVQTVADAVLEDLSKLDIPEVAEARAFSRAKNDVFSRSFAGKILDLDRSGARRTPPELTLEQAFGSGGTRAAVRFRDLGKAAEFPGKFGGTSFADVVSNEQEAFLRLAAEDVFKDGNFNPDRLRDFLSRNQEVLKQFPEVANDLADVETARRTLMQVRKASETASKVIAKRAAFAKLVDVDNPVPFVRETLASPNAERTIRQLARMTRRTGEGAKAGFRASVIDALMQESRNADNTISFANLLQRMNAPLSPGGKNVLDVLVSEKAMSRADAARLRKLVERGAEIELGVKRGGVPVDISSPQDMLSDLVTRAIGASVAENTMVGRSFGGQSLVVASAGSRAAKKIAEQIPASRVGDVLAEAASNPQFMAALLRKPKTQRERIKLIRQLNGFLISAGIISEENDGEETP